MLRPFSGYQEHIIAPIPFLWSSTFSTGNEELDSQHSLVFRLINTLLQCDGVPRALECLVELHKAVEEAFSTEETYMDSLLADQKSLTRNLADKRGDDDSSYSTLGSDHKTQNDKRGLRYIHPTTGRIIELEGPPLSEQIVDQHMTKHQLFLEDLESIRRRLDFNGAARRFDDDADFRGKRELEYIANWYIHHITLDDAHLRISNTLCQKLSDGHSSGLDSSLSPQKSLEPGSGRPKMMVKFHTSEFTNAVRHESLSDSEMETLRHHPNLIFTRDWLAFIQQQFVVGICILRLPSVGRSSRAVLANAPWTEFTRLYPWLAAKAEYENLADGGDVINVKRNHSGSCWVRKQKLLGGNNVRLRVISVSVPVKIRSRLFSSEGDYMADLSFFQTRDLARDEESALVSSAFARQRTALQSKSYLGDFSDQNLTTSGASLGWQHAPLGTPIFDHLVSWLAVELLLDRDFMENEMPNIEVEVTSEVLKTRENDLIVVLREGVVACSRAKTETENSTENPKTLNLPPRHAISHLSALSDDLAFAGLTPGAHRDSLIGSSAPSPPALFRSRVDLKLLEANSDESFDPISYNPISESSSHLPEDPLNVLVQSFGATDLAQPVTDDGGGTELEDLRKYMQPPAAKEKESVSRETGPREKGAKKGRRGHKSVRRKKLMD